MKSKRTEKIEKLNDLSEDLDFRRFCLRSNKKFYQENLEQGIQLISIRLEIEKLERLIRILEIRFRKQLNEIENDRNSILFDKIEVVMKQHGAIPGDWRHFFEDLFVNKKI